MDALSCRQSKTQKQNSPQIQANPRVNPATIPFVCVCVYCLVLLYFPNKICLKLLEIVCSRQEYEAYPDRAEKIKIWLESV